MWASGKGGTIKVDGAVNINANYFADESATRSAGEDVHLAVVAGLKSKDKTQNGTGLKDETQNGAGLVDINLKGDVTSSFMVILSVQEAVKWILDVNPAMAL